MKKIALMLEWTTDTSKQRQNALNLLVGDKQLVSDYDEDVLIASSGQAVERIEDILEDARIGYEAVELLALPQGALLRDSFTDFGIVTAAGNAYAFAHLAAVFRLSGREQQHSQSVPQHPPQRPQAPVSEPLMAEQQLDEHVLASFTEQPYVWYAIERHLLPLAEGIARAYGCSVITAAP